MMKIATELANAKKTLENVWGEDAVAEILSKARAKIDEIKEVTGVDNELAIIRTNIKLSDTPEARAVWMLCLGE